MQESGLVQIITVKFSKYSKEYSYICDDVIKIGDFVKVEDKDKPFQVTNVKLEKIEDLPVDYKEMKSAKLMSLEEMKLNELICNNSILKRFGRPINLIGRDDIIEELLISINKIRMKNTILIGEAGCGKTAIVESFSEMVKGHYFVLGFTIGELVSGTAFRGTMEERITSIFNDVLEFNKKYKKKIILFIDEIHLIANSYSINESLVSDFMKTYLTDDNIIVIGATTIKEFNSSIKRDNATMRRLSPLFIPILNDASVIQVLKNFSNNEIDDSLLELILEESKEIPNATNPDVSIEILDRALARSKVLSEDLSSNMIYKIVDLMKVSYGT